MDPTSHWSSGRSTTDKAARCTYAKTLEAVRLVTLELGHLLLNDLWADDWSNLHHLQSQTPRESPLNNLDARSVLSSELQEMVGWMATGQDALQSRLVSLRSSAVSAGLRLSLSVPAILLSLEWRAERERSISVRICCALCACCFTSDLDLRSSRLCYRSPLSPPLLHHDCFGCRRCSATADGHTPTAAAVATAFHPVGHPSIRPPPPLPPSLALPLPLN